MAAKGTKIGATVALDGEREFKKALAEINAGLQVNASELAKVAASYADNSSSVAALTAKNEVLDSRILSQTDKVAKLREALEQSASTYGEADTRTLKWQTSLNKAETELIKLETELDKNKEAVKGTGDALSKAGDQSRTAGQSILGFTDAIGIQLPAGARKAVESIDGAKISLIALGAATVGIIGGFAKMTLETTKAAGEIDELSHKTGLSVEKIQELQYAAEYLEVSAETIGGAMSKLTRSMDTARSGTGDAAEAFRQLHIKVTDGNGGLKDSETVFYSVIDALGQVRNETEKEALSMSLFGKSARELNNLILEGSTGIKAYAKDAQDMGYVMSKEQIDKFNVLDDAMVKFKKTGETTRNSLALALLPALTLFFDALSGVSPTVLSTIVIVASMAVVIVTTIKAVKSATDAFGGWAERMNKAHPAISTTTIKIVAAVAAFIALAAIIAVIMGKTNDLDRTFANVGNTVGNMTNTVNGTGRQVGRNAKGTNNWRGGLTWVGEEGPELIAPPQGTQIFSNPQSMRMMSEASGFQQPIQQNIVVHVSAADLQKQADVVKLFEGLRQAGRAGVR